MIEKIDSVERFFYGNYWVDKFYNIGEYFGFTPSEMWIVFTASWILILLIAVSFFYSCYLEDKNAHPATNTNLPK